MKIPFRALIVASALFFASDGRAYASQQSGAVFANYWTEFSDYWHKVFKNQNGISMTIVGVGILSLFIITRGKWKK